MKLASDIVLKSLRVLLLTSALLKKQLRTIRTWRRWIVCFGLGGLIVFALTGAILSGSFNGWSRSSAKHVVAVSDEPHRVRPLVQPLFSRESPEARLVAFNLRHPPSITLNGSILCHLLRVHGLNAMSHLHFSSGMDVVKVLTDDTLAKKYLGTSVVFQTREGVRYKLPSPDGPRSQDGENHRDLFLSTFAELGLPLTTPIKTSTGSFTLRDLLMDSIQNFDLKQEEIVWTAIAYILYIPPKRMWNNRFGETFTFDDLAAELLERPTRDSPCGGTHLFYALTLLARVGVDTEVPFLSESARHTVLRRLQDWVLSAVKSQADEGYWNLEWNQQNAGAFSNFDTHFYRFLITGHILECMQYLPVSIQPDPKVYRKAVNWLYSELNKISTPSGPRFFCPWTHAICSIRNLIGGPAELIEMMAVDPNRLDLVRATAWVARVEG